MEKAVIDFILNNLKNTAQGIIYRVEEAKDEEAILCSIDELHNFRTYSRTMLVSGGILARMDRKNSVENHIESYRALLDILLSILIIDFSNAQNKNAICSRALEMVEKYADPKEVIEVDRGKIRKTLIGKK